MKRIVLGNSGVEVSRLATGTGSNGWAHASDQTKRGKRWLENILVEGLAVGVTFWDLADQYGSHPNAAAALMRVDRNQVEILTKTASSGYDECRKDLVRFKKELGTDYLDIVLLHCMTSKAWNQEREGAMRALSEAKAAGTIKAVGVSCHSLTALKTAAKEPWVDILLARINYSGDSMDAPPAEVIPVLQHAFGNGKGVIGMKVYGCGTISGDPAKAIDYVLGLGSIHAITIGPTEDDHFRQNVKLLESFDAVGKSSVRTGYINR